ncbi:MAG: DegT/DnrJ/EryC1/StrS family aminotransferase, partial [Planctomycetes bacterium]|nr:DegT/DnrJ/EryC1/StrS family aminotransferase [Planctomycetota bacterium]
SASHACQAWLAEWGGKKCGTLGDLGCFSFQESKHLPAGEGGAVVGNDEALMDHVMAFHNCGRIRGKSGYSIIGHNRRMTEVQGAILLNQMTRLDAETVRRTENANYLTSKIKDIPGIVPHKLSEGATRAVYHLYPMRYKQEQFGGLSRNRFIAALSAEGIPCGSVYGPQYKDGLIEAALTCRSFTRAFPKARLDRYREELHYPGNEQLCQEAVCFTQNMLLGPKSDMDDIANAIQKIYENRNELLKSQKS